MNKTRLNKINKAFKSQVANVRPLQVQAPKKKPKLQAPKKTINLSKGKYKAVRLRRLRRFGRSRRFRQIMLSWHRYLFVKRAKKTVIPETTEIFSHTGNAGTPAWFQKAWTTTGGFEKTSFRIYFHYASGTSYTGDLAIDYVKVGSTLIGDQFNTAEGWKQRAYDSSTETVDQASASTLWVNLTNSTNDWNQEAGTTPSRGTGPSSAYNGSLYVYAETSGGGSNSNYWLRSPVITTTGTAESISAYISAYGSTIGTLTAYVVPE